MSTADDAVVERDVEPACPTRKQCKGKSYTDGKARHFSAFYAPCGNDECFPDADSSDDVDGDTSVVIGRGRGMSRMHRPRSD